MDTNYSAFNNQTGLWIHTIVDANNHAKSYVYDAFDNLAVVQEYEGKSHPRKLYSATFYRYDVMGHLIDVWDADKNHTHMKYDPLGRKTDMYDPDMGHWKYSYDDNGNLVTQTDARDCKINLTYDPLNRLIKKTYSGSCQGMEPVAYYFDGAGHGYSYQYKYGQRTKMEDKSGYTVYQYDVRGRLIREEKKMRGVDKPFITTYTYDFMDRVQTTTYPDGEKVTSHYNRQGLQEGLTGNLNGQNTYLAQTDYNAMDQINYMVFGNRDTITNTYDSRSSRLRSKRIDHSGLYLEKKYDYDGAGNIKKLSEEFNSSPQRYLINTRVQEFTYDHVNRLIAGRVSDYLPDMP